MTRSRRRAQPPSPTPSARQFVRRALVLRCPECGISPIFQPLRLVRSLDGWFRPLDGCPRCGYAYERESGYFLLAIWGVNYGLIAGGGLLIALFAQSWLGWSITPSILLVAVPMPVLSVLFARHAKALYLAMDHYFDPHVREGMRRQETSR